MDATRFPGGSDDDPVGASELEAVLQALHVRTGQDFAPYKEGTVMRRVRRRMSALGLSSLAAYAELIASDPEEPRRLKDALMIGVTRFFRDPEAFEQVRHLALAEIVKARRPEEPVRIWVPGCSTGEEAYSLAFEVSDAMRREQCQAPFKVFATDIDAEALATGRSGLYGDSAAQEVPAPYLERYFNRIGGKYEVDKSIRDCMVFAEQDLLQDPPFSRIDLVSCRNLFIYLDAEAQERAIALLHFALNPGGYLFLGQAEGTAILEHLFKPLSKKARIYQRLDAGRSGPSIGRLALPSRPVAKGAQLPNRGTLGHLVHQRLMAEYAPPAILVNSRFEILYLEGSLGAFLDLPMGEPKLDLMHLCPPILFGAVVGAVSRAWSTGAKETAGPVSIERHGRTLHVRISARPVSSPEEASLGLVTFEELCGLESPEVRLTSGEVSVVQLVEAELKNTKKDLLATIEAMENYNQELQASNEEMLSMNEELQASNEELQTAKEELQSVNEELTTVNTELSATVDELERAKDDLSNLLISTGLATVFLDPQMRIRWYSPSARDLFNVIPTDIGRPIADLTAQLDDPTLLADAHEVLANQAPRDREVRGEPERWYLRHVTPYRTNDGQVEGVVVTYAEITELKTAELSRRQAEQRLSHLVRAVKDYAIFFLDTQGRIQSWNEGAQRLKGYTSGEIVGQSFERFYTPEDRAAGLPGQLLATAREEGRVEHEGWRVRKDKSRFWADVVITAIHDEAGELIGFAKVTRDLTERRNAELERDRLHAERIEALEQADRLKDQFLSILSHELRTPINAITGFGSVLDDEIAGPLSAKQHEYLGKMLDGASNLLALVDDLLDMSRIQAGKCQLFVEEMELGELAREVLETLAPLLGRKHLISSLELPGGIVTIRADRQRIRQVFVNLVQNAIKFTPEGGRIVVRARRQGERAVCEVEDTGIGIAASDIPKLFSPFTQLDMSDSRKVGGAGLGLSICKALVEAHGGRIGVRSQVGQGSTFWFEIPVEGPEAP